MKSLFVKALGGLDNQTPEHNVDPSNATIAQYFDPFRAKSGGIAPCFGFKDITVTNWHSESSIFIAFYLGGRLIVAMDSGHCKYIEDDELLDMDDADLHNNASSIHVDNKSYSIGKKTEPDFIEIYNAYLFGKERTYEETRKPKRLIIAKKYHNPEDYPDDPEILWYTLDMALDTFPEILRFRIEDYSGDSYNDSDWDGWQWYYYFLLLEDCMGNYIMRVPEGRNDFSEYYKRWNNTTNERPPILSIDWDRMGIDVTEILGITKIHIYRARQSAIFSDDEFAEEIFNTSRWCKTIDIQDEESFSIEWRDPEPLQSGLGDIIYPGHAEMKQWMVNINNTNEAIGLHNGALWVARDNEVLFSEYSLSSPYGTRPLNFPTDNRWRFEGIGQIAEIQSVNSVLVVFGTEGVSTLTGTYLDNYYEKKISNVGILRTRDHQYRQTGGREFIKATTIIDDKIYFVSNEGIPCVYYNYDVVKLLNMRIPINGEVINSSPDYEVLDPINTCHYRDGWMISNGTSIYLYDINKNTWFEWPETVWRFIYGADPYYENETLGLIAANEYSYLRFFKFDVLDRQVREYATDGTVPIAIWKTPQIRLDGVKRIAFLKLYWDYNLVYRYENKDTDSADRTAQSIDVELDIYLDDNTSSTKTVDFEPSEIVDGSYVTSILLNVRAEKFAFRLYGSAMKYLQLTGYELIYEDRGHKRFG